MLGMMRYKFIGLWMVSLFFCFARNSVAVNDGSESPMRFWCNLPMEKLALHLERVRLLERLSFLGSGEQRALEAARSLNQADRDKLEKLMATVDLISTSGSWRAHTARPITVYLKERQGPSGTADWHSVDVQVNRVRRNPDNQKVEIELISADGIRSIPLSDISFTQPGTE